MSQSVRGQVEVSSHLNYYYYFFLNHSERRCDRRPLYTISIRTSVTLDKTFKSIKGLEGR